MANKEQKPLLLFWTTWTLLWSLLVPFISCQAIGTMYHFSEIRTGSIVCEDIPECIEPPECEIIYVVTGCSTTRQDTTNDCESITEEPTNCDSTTNSQPTTEFPPFSFPNNITQVSHTPTMSEGIGTGTKEPTSTDSTATSKTVDPTINSLRTTLETDRSTVTDTTENTGITLGSTQITPVNGAQSTTDKTMHTFINTMESSKATTIEDNMSETAATDSTTSKSTTTTGSETPTSQFTDSQRTTEPTATTFGSTDIPPDSGTQATTEVTFTKMNTLTEARTAKSDTSQTPFIMTMETSEDTTIKDRMSTTTATAPCESKRCPCPQYLYGKNCMFIQDDIRLDKVIAKLAVTVHVENVIFTPELEDTTSQAYQTFQKRFIEEIKPFYNSKISNFKDVKINKARNGSIVVDHEVLLTVNFRNYMEETKQTEQLLLRYLKEAICTSSSPDKLCFRVNTSTVTAKEVSLTELCSEDEAIPEEMKMYFRGLNETTFLLCMTECSENNESPINCNWGMCSTSAAGSNCNCDISDEYWYTGSHCETPISKPGVIAGVTVGLIILVIIIMVLVIAFCWRRRVADNETLLEDGGNKHWYGFGWKRNLNIQGKCWNPNMDSKMFGPNGSFRSTKEVNVNPQEKMHIPRPRVIS